MSISLARHVKACGNTRERGLLWIVKSLESRRPCYPAPNWDQLDPNTQFQILDKRDVVGRSYVFSNRAALGGGD